MQINIFYSSIEDFINSEGSILYKVVGKSMEPMLRPNKDLVLIRKKKITDKYVENDVVLYKSRGKLILHRIIKVESPGRYIMLGDNSSRKEHDVPEDKIIGVLQCFYRDGVLFSTTNKTYVSYIERMRECENKRISKKTICNFILWYLRFLPVPIQAKIKICIRHLLNYNYIFE